MPVKLLRDPWRAVETGLGVRPVWPEGVAGAPQYSRVPGAAHLAHARQWVPRAILWGRTLEPREVWELAQGHTA